MSISTAMCPKCGNPIIPYTTATIKPTFSNGFTSATIITSDHTMPFCVCPVKTIESTEKHDGQINGRNSYKVALMFPQRPEIANIRIGHDETTDDEVWLSPAQFLSLMEWGRQNSIQIEQLAKEQ